MRAHAPEDCDRLVIEAINAGDVEAALALYEPETAFVAEPGKVVTGAAAIREVMNGFVAMKAQLTIEVPLVAQSGDLALLHSR